MRRKWWIHSFCCLKKKEKFLWTWKHHGLHGVFCMGLTSWGCYFSMCTVHSAWPCLCLWCAFVICDEIHGCIVHLALLNALLTGPGCQAMPCVTEFVSRRAGWLSSYMQCFTSLGSLYPSTRRSLTCCIPGSGESVHSQSACAEVCLFLPVLCPPLPHASSSLRSPVALVVWEKATPLLLAGCKAYISISIAFCRVFPILSQQTRRPLFTDGMFSQPWRPQCRFVSASTENRGTVDSQGAGAMLLSGRLQALGNLPLFLSSPSLSVPGSLCSSPGYCSLHLVFELHVSAFQHAPLGCCVVFRPPSVWGCCLESEGEAALISLSHSLFPRFPGASMHCIQCSCLPSSHWSPALEAELFHIPGTLFLTLWEELRGSALAFIFSQIASR